MSERFKIQSEKEKVTIHNWKPNEEGYDSISGVIQEIRDFNPQLANEMGSVKIDRVGEKHSYRFFVRQGGGVGVMTFSMIDGKYQVESIELNLRMLDDNGNELNGIEAVTNYYFPKLEG